VSTRTELQNQRERKVHLKPVFGFFNVATSTTWRLYVRDAGY